MNLSPITAENIENEPFALSMLALVTDLNRRCIAPNGSVVADEVRRQCPNPPADDVHGFHTLGRLVLGGLICNAGGGRSSLVVTGAGLSVLV